MTVVTRYFSAHIQRLNREVRDESGRINARITESQIQETMRELFTDRTVITITHRLSTVVDCDEIVFLDQGRILARGAHAILLHTCPRYHELCEKQLVPSVSETV